MMASFTTKICADNDKTSKEYSKKFTKLQSLNRVIYDQMSSSKPVTLQNIKSLALAERPNSTDHTFSVDLKRRNIILLQLTAIIILAERSSESPQYCTIIETLMEEDDLPLVLMDYAVVDDVYLSYMGTKCIVSLLFMYGTQEPKNWQMVLLQDFVAKTTAHKSYTCHGIIYRLIHKLLSRSRSLAMKCHAIATVGASWRFYFTLVNEIVYQLYVENNLEYDIKKVGTVASFLRLWKRIIKTKRILQNEIEGDVSENSVRYISVETHDDFFKLSPKLLDIIWLSKHVYVIQTRALDLTNAILTYYGGNAREIKHVKTLAKATIAGVIKNLFHGIDFHRYITFGWSKVAKKVSQVIHGTVINKDKRINKFILRKATLLACNAGMETLDASQSYMKKVVSALEKTSSLGRQFKEIETLHGEGLLYWVKDVFNEQDDDWIQLLLSLLSITIDQRQIEYVPQPHLRDVQIHVLFSHFCETIHYDSTLLLDLIMSSETLFLLFFTKYLKFLLADWTGEDSVGFSADFSALECSISTSADSKEIPADTTGSYYYDPYTTYTTESQTLAAETITRNDLASKNFNLGMFSQLDIDKTPEPGDPSVSSSMISFQSCDSNAHVTLILSDRVKIENMIYMFSQLLVSLQKMKDANLIVFNVTPIIRLLYKIQRIRPHVLKGYVKLVQESNDPSANVASPANATSPAAPQPKKALADDDKDS